MSDIGEDGDECGCGCGDMGDDACPELVGGSFQAEAQESSGWGRAGECGSSKVELDVQGFVRGETFLLLVEAWVIA